MKRSRTKGRTISLLILAGFEESVGWRSAKLQCPLTLACVSEFDQQNSRSPRRRGTSRYAARNSGRVRQVGPPPPLTQSSEPGNVCTSNPAWRSFSLVFRVFFQAPAGVLFPRKARCRPACRAPNIRSRSTGSHGIAAVPRFLPPARANPPRRFVRRAGSSATSDAGRLKALDRKARERDNTSTLRLKQRSHLGNSRSIGAIALADQAVFWNPATPCLRLRFFPVDRICPATGTPDTEAEFNVVPCLRNAIRLARIQPDQTLIGSQRRIVSVDGIERKVGRRRQMDYFRAGGSEAGGKVASCCACAVRELRRDEEIPTPASGPADGRIVPSRRPRRTHQHALQGATMEWPLKACAVPDLSL